jgi:hypothetical protein
VFRSGSLAWGRSLRGGLGPPHRPPPRRGRSLKLKDEWCPKIAKAHSCPGALRSTKIGRPAGRCLNNFFLVIPSE